MAEATAEHETARRPRRWAVVVGVLVLLAAVAAVLAYVLRGPIGARVAVDYLRSRGVPASVRVERLDASGFVARVRLGRADRPDLSIERLEVRFAEPWTWRSGLGLPAIKSIRMLRPDLNISYDGRRFRFGALQRLVDELAARPPSGAPPPDIEADQAVVHLNTPAGPVLASGDAAVEGGRIVRLDAAVRGRLARQGQTVRVTGGAVSLRGSPERLDARLQLAGDVSTDATTHPVTAADLIADLRLSTANPLVTAFHIEGPASLSGTVRAARAELAGAAIASPAVTVAFTGALGASRNGAAAEGKGRLTLAAARSRGDGADLSAGAADLQLDRIAVDFRPSGWRASAAGTGRLSIDAAALAGAGRIAHATWSGRGEVYAAPDAIGGSWRGPLQLDAGLATAQARRLVAGLPLESKARATLSSALQRARVSGREVSVGFDPNGVTVVAPAPIAVTAPGLQLAVSGRAARPLFSSSARAGGFSLRATGPSALQLALDVSRYRFGAGRAEAAVRLDAGLDTALAQGLKVAGGGVLVVTGGQVSLRTAGCTQLAAARVGGEPPVLQDAHALLCPAAAAPLLTAGPSGWRLVAEARSVGGVAPQMMAKVADGQATLELRSGSGGVPAGEVRIARAVVSDTTAEPRFRPLLVSGPLASAGPDWRGRLQLAEAAHGRPIGSVTVTQAPASGEGQALIEAADLKFDPSGLQPGDIFQAAKSMIAGASGEASFTGEARWSRDGLASHGRLVTGGVSFESPLGKVTGARTDLTLTSLAPLITPPGQTARADRIDSLVSLQAPTGRFSIGPDAWQVETAEAGASGGRVRLAPTRIPLAPDAAITTQILLEDVDLGALVASTSLADKVKLTAKVSGDVRVTAGPDGFRIDDGRLYATGPGRLTIARSALQGAVSSGGQPGATSGLVQDFAYQALENLAFESLDATLRPLAQGRLGILFHIKGRHDPPVAPPPPKINLFDALRGRAFSKPMALPKGTPINLTLDTSLNFEELMKAYMDAMRPLRSGGVQP